MPTTPSPRRAGRPSATGATGAQGPAGSSGSGGGGSLNNFDRLIPANGTFTVTVGQFTASEVANPAGCSDVMLINNSAFAGELAETGGQDATTPAGSFTGIGAASTTAIVAAQTGSHGDVDTFNAALNNGGSFINGTIGGLTINGNACVVTGFVTGG